MEHSATILNSLNVFSAPASRREQRNAPRYSRDGMVTIFPVVGGQIGQAMPVRFKDISATGLGFYHSDRMLKGARFIVGLAQAGGKITLILYSVVRCVQLSKTSNEVGAILIATLRGNDIAEGRSFPGVNMESISKDLIKRIEGQHA